MALGDNEGSEALYAPMLRPAPVDAALLIAVHRGLEAVPVRPLNAEQGADGSATAIRSEGGGSPVPCGTSGIPVASHPSRRLAHRQRP
ncbi:hypothetical protein [Cellulomonas sp. SG140]|uniref:hypothetical protein n=1 Tax=Cellulomonas sp. SG140 TaxID=2976536 RepID=UPI0021E867F0|nr:hypothetical protein [Cellulomonas sp. SG140]